ncbi:MAG TPA: fatty acid desaturase [Verrucomicrobiae bacterium]|nr:fatty acid desaturase [Verrucomicrobiae bacterium]
MLAVLIDWSLIAAALALGIHTRNAGIWLLVLLVVGNRQHALSVLGHDGAHFLICKNRALNDWLACLFSWWPLGVGLHGYRKFHFQHHRYSGTVLDPELDIKRKEKPEWDLPLKKRTMGLYFLKDLLGLSAPNVVHLFEATKPIKKSDWLGPIVVWAIFAGALYHVHHLRVLLFWFAAMPTTFWAMFRVRVYHEHHGTSKTHRVHLPLWYRELFAPHNIWVHYEHHKWPHLPYYFLHKVRHLDASVPIISVFELLSGYKNSEKMESGTVLEQDIQASHPLELLPE